MRLFPTEPDWVPIPNKYLNICWVNEKCMNEEYENMNIWLTRSGDGTP